MIRFRKLVCCVGFALLTSGCNVNVENFAQKANSLKSEQFLRFKAASYAEKEKVEASPLDSLLNDQGLVVSFEQGFEAAIAAAVIADPVIVSLEDDVLAKESAVRVLASQKRLKGSGSIYGGYEDISDDVAGLAVVLNANRILFDGGSLDARIAASQFYAESAGHNLKLNKNQRAADFLILWIELEQFEKLDRMLNDRLAILDPLIKQLEKVAKSGIGDVTMVSAAKRTVDNIKVKKTEVGDNLEKARLNFKNAFGGMPGASTLDLSQLTGLVPSEISPEMIQSAPAMLAEYSSYRAAEATLASVRAKDKFNIGLEMRASRPFGKSEYNSDESIGFVLNKTLFNGAMLASEIEEAEARVKIQISRLKAAYREGNRIAKSSLQTVSTMESAISLASNNVKLASEEIAYLKQQLTIGGSTLESVLRAEAGLYAAQEKEINFTVNKRKSELKILAGLGMLSDSLGL